MERSLRTEKQLLGWKLLGFLAFFLIFLNQLILQKKKKRVNNSELALNCKLHCTSASAINTQCFPLTKTQLNDIRGLRNFKLHVNILGLEGWQIVLILNQEDTNAPRCLHLYSTMEDLLLSM